MFGSRIAANSIVKAILSKYFNESAEMETPLKKPGILLPIYEIRFFQTCFSIGIYKQTSDREEIILTQLWNALYKRQISMHFYNQLIKIVEEFTYLMIYFLNLYSK